MRDMTAEQILAMISENSKTPTIDLGTELNFSDSAEMYSNSHYKEKGNKNKKKNTFQQSSVNVRGRAPALVSSPSAPSVKEDQEIPGDHVVGSKEPKYGRRLNWQTDKIVEMRLQIGDVRIGKRYHRATAYISIKTETDLRYMIFMRSALTTAHDETFRGIKKDNDKVLKTLADDFVNEHSNTQLFLGRVKYKITKGQKIQKHHRENLPVTLLGMWLEDDEFHARLHLLGEDYDFILTDDISENQKKWYEYEGVWQLHQGTMSIEEAFNGE
jgi:hypothetical protein